MDAILCQKGKWKHLHTIYASPETSPDQLSCSKQQKRQVGWDGTEKLAILSPISWRISKLSLIPPITHWGGEFLSKIRPVTVNKEAILFVHLYVVYKSFTIQKRSDL